MGILSPFARVKVLLSSRTEFRFSIQIASTGPSRTIQTFSPWSKKYTCNTYHTFTQKLMVALQHFIITFLALRVFLQSVEKTPSVQSLVVTSSIPNICEAVMALGFIRISLWGAPHSVMAFISVWMQVVFPEPLGPNIIIPAGRTRQEETGVIT